MPKTDDKCFCGTGRDALISPEYVPTSPWALLSLFCPGLTLSSLLPQASVKTASSRLLGVTIITRLSLGIRPQWGTAQLSATSCSRSEGPSDTHTHQAVATCGDGQENGL